jgi:hypothetical protein
MEIDGPFRREIRLALLDAFPTLDQLRLFVDDSMSERLQNVSLANDLPSVVFDLIVWAQARGRLTELVQAAAGERPKNPTTQAVAARFQFATRAGGEIERVVLENVGFQNIAQWLDKLARVRRAVCRVEPQSPTDERGRKGYGTGFLVGPDVVMTNCHVKDVFSKPAQVVFRFDYETDANGIEVSKGREYRLAVDGGWDLKSSPLGRLDFALVRLSSPAATEQVGGQARGLLPIDPPPVARNDPMLILQHPDSEPMKLTFGSVLDPAVSPTELAYSANTKPGSSGSPCLTVSLEAVALHHWGERGDNRGVRMQTIRDYLRDEGALGLIGSG